MTKPVMLLIMDGWGENPRKDNNSVFLAKTPNLNRLAKEYPTARLEASGEAVGIMAGQMGDSNVGHLNLGAGRIVYQDLVRLNKAVDSGEFFTNPEIVKVFDNVAKKGTALHLMGLVSPGGVHSHTKHLYALLELAAKKGLSKVYVHAFLDGRDVPPASAKEYLEELEAKIREIGVGAIATISGRYYAMDRDNRWERVEKAYQAIVLGQGVEASSALEAVEKSYQDNVTDEFVLPTVVMQDGAPVGKVNNGDGVIFFNFRFDRARQLTRAFVDQSFTGFTRKKLDLDFLCMTRYDEKIEAPFAFAPLENKNTLGEWLSKKGKKQLRIAETEKYAHVTFFFNGLEETPFPLEERILVPSPQVATYDLKPEMSAYEVTGKVVDAIESDQYDCIILNYANGDMVGHTGVLLSAIRAVETVDTCVGKVVDAVLAKDGVVFITADHGNCEQMKDYETGDPYTAHTLNEVPVILVSKQKQNLRDKGVLADVAPTLLRLMGIEPPVEMTGKSLIKQLGSLNWVNNNRK